jgi:hypothetical protein
MHNEMTKMHERKCMNEKARSEFHPVAGGIHP